MSRFRFYILPRLCLGLSVLLLLFGGWVLWLSLGRPLPSRELACRQEETARLLSPGRTVAQGTIRYPNTVWQDANAWLARRYGDAVGVYSFCRLGGVLWREVRLEFYAPEPDFDAFTVDAALNRGPGHSWYVTPMAVCGLPDAARLEADVVWLGSWEDDPAAAITEHGATTELTRAGDCVWVGPALRVAVPDSPGSNSGTALHVYCRAYDADGNLLAVYDPTANYSVPSTE